MRILVAEDEQETRGRLQRCLESAGHEVVCVGDGAEAHELLERDPAVSLLIAAWRMPQVDGVELCRRIRSANHRRYLPIILLPSDRERQQLIEGLDAGADAFVRKPVDGAEVLAQIRVAERILRLQDRLEAQLLYLSQARDRLEKDLWAAAEVQRSLLPSELPSIPGLEFAWVYDACDLVGGDMFNVVRLDEHRVGLYVLDVSGHGTSAALLSVSLSRVLTPFPQQGGILKRTGPEPPFYELVPPAEVAGELNRRFQLITQSGQYFTFLYAILDVRTRELRYVRAGHPPLIQVGSHGAQLREVGGGVPIGVTEDAEYRDETLQLCEGDLVLAYTDGVNEARSPDDEEFGTGRMLDLLIERRKNGSGVADTVQALRKAIEEFRGGTRPRDDVTMVGLGVR
ncbi:MAG: SpoIIE family protein phosphatase [Myxococcota bacterium]